jgi:hypothetical protein
MNDSTGQFGAGGSAPDAQGQSKMNPMSPTFMDSASGFQPSPPPATPSNPPMGGNPATSSPSPLSSPPPPPPSVYKIPAEGMASVPPPPPKEVDIRTMTSDQESSKTNGGLDPMPITIIPTVAGVGAKKIDSVGMLKRKPSGNKKALLIGLGIIVFLGAAAAVANWFVLPLFLNNVADVAEESPVVVPEESESTLPDITPTIPTFIHESFFSGQTDAEVGVRVDEISLAGIKGGMAPVVANVLASGNTLTEFYVVAGGGDMDQPVTSEELLGVVLPDLILATPLEDDFTGFLYGDGTSVWSGYVFALDKTAEDKDLLKSILGEDLEASSSLNNFFLNDPGLPSATVFKNGSAVGELTSTRYLPYTATGASLNYGWKGDRLVISTSYAGLKAVASMVGNSEIDSGAEGTL